MNHDWFKVGVVISAVLSIANAFVLFYPHKGMSPLENNTISSIASKVEAKSKEYYNTLAKTSQDAATKLKSEFDEYRTEADKKLHNAGVESKKQLLELEKRLKELEKRR